MKQCKFCAEDVKDEAIKCKHCGSMLTEGVNLDILDATQAAKSVTKGIKQKQLHDDLRVTGRVKTSQSGAGQNRPGLM